MRPADATSAAACSSSVDFPMPGSPPSRTSEPGTRPPPSTRSSSLTPVETRSASEASMSAKSRAPAPVSAGREPGPARLAAVSSTSEFHSPQSGHRPSHFRAWAPHDRQT